MDLFSKTVSDRTNLLPRDGAVFYYGAVFSCKQADDYLELLLHHIQWQHDEAIIFGKKITTKRKVAWYGEKPYDYTYSNVTKTALPWTRPLLDLKHVVEQHSGATYNACLLNLYHDGSEGMAWHSDGEKDLKKHGSIASVSFGAERKFAFKHKQTGEKVALWLQHGSLLIMKDETQDFWLHRLPPAALIQKPRVNLTFRTIEG